MVYTNQTQPIIHYLLSIIPFEEFMFHIAEIGERITLCPSHLQATVWIAWIPTYYQMNIYSFSFHIHHDSRANLQPLATTGNPYSICWWKCCVYLFFSFNSLLSGYWVLTDFLKHQPSITVLREFWSALDFKRGSTVGSLMLGSGDLSCSSV